MAQAPQVLSFFMCVCFSSNFFFYRYYNQTIFEVVPYLFHFFCEMVVEKKKKKEKHFIFRMSCKRKIVVGITITLSTCRKVPVILIKHDSNTNHKCHVLVLVLGTSTCTNLLNSQKCEQWI